MKFDPKYDWGFRVGRWYFIRAGRRPRVNNRPGRTSTKLPSTTDATSESGSPASDPTTAAPEAGTSVTQPEPRRARTSHHKEVTRKPGKKRST